MGTFFSGTDLNTLKEEGLDRNHFVSLIVNNEGTYTAGITRKIKYVRNITEEFCYNTFNNGIIKDSDNYSVEDESIEWFNLDIIVENTDFSDISNRLQEIKDNKRRLVNNNSIVNNGPININSHSNIFIPDVNKDEELPFDWDFIDNNADIPYGRITFNKDIIKSLTLQLVTGSCIISNESKIDINKWAQGMENLFNKRFQSANSKMFNAWAENFIEYFCFYTEDPKLRQILNDESAEMAILAYDLIKSLSKLPSNNYIKVYIKILKDYLL